MTGEENGGSVFDADLALKAVRPAVDQLDLISRSGRPTRAPEAPSLVAPRSDSDSEIPSSTPISTPIGLEDTLVPEPVEDVPPDAASSTHIDDAPPALDGDGDPTESIDDPRIPAGQAFFKIGEVADIVGVKPYVLRYWENEFSWVKPEKTSSRQRRYRRQDVAVLLQIKRLRYEEQLTVARTRELIRESRQRGATGLPTSLVAGPTAVAPASVAPAQIAVMRQIIASLIEAAEED